MKTLPLLIALCASWSIACAQGLPMNLFVKALKEGKSSSPVPNDPKVAYMIQSIQAKTHDNGPLNIEVFRVARFTQQPSCGRVSFVISQPSSKATFPQLGGDLNICESGMPPWRICKGTQEPLIPPGGTCPDKSTPQDTPEVIAAIQSSLTNGSRTHEEVRKTLQPTKSPATGTKNP